MFRQARPAQILTLSGIEQSPALSISTEVERGFRFFKYNSDFELHRLAYRDFQNTHGGQKPSIHELDALLGNKAWWEKSVHTKTAAWYGYREALSPLVMLEQWRKREISDEGRAPGYLELSNTLGSWRGWEYSPVRIGWASLLFPAHQSAEDLGNPKLVNSSAVAVCWDRAEQAHTNCGGLNAYVVPNGHSIFLRAVDAGGLRLLDGLCSWEIDLGTGANFVNPAGADDGHRQVSCSAEVVAFIPADKQVRINLRKDAEQAEAAVSVDDHLVVGIGDSFSSGEGNPDVPTKLGWTGDTRLDWASDGSIVVDQTTQGPVRKAIGDYFAAQWIDRSCHRSAYSYQLRSALYLAVENPYAITFLGYACSGAEVNEGLFNPQVGPEKTTSKIDADVYRKAQLSLLLSELCQKYNGDSVRKNPLTDSEERNAIASNTYRFGGVISDRAYRCWNTPAGGGFKRPIDLLYVSIGGNDAGFAKWILAAISTEGTLGSFLPTLSGSGNQVCQSHAASCRETRKRWNALEARYALLRDFVDNRLAFARNQASVLLLTYPLPFQASDDTLCPPGNSGLTIWLGAKPGWRKAKDWICLSRTAKGLPTLETIGDFTDQKLNHAIEALASPDDGHGGTRPAWQAITGFRPKFDGRGFCASRLPAEPFTDCKTYREVGALVKTLSFTREDANETLHYPMGFKSPRGDWRPFGPVFDYMPYAHRTRLVRTMNETYFLVNQLVAAVQGTKASGVLSLKDAAVYGAFHPTAEAHAIFADAFRAKSDDILNKAK